MARVTSPEGGFEVLIGGILGYLGDTNDYGSEHTMISSESMYCVRYTAPVSGTLGKGYVQHYGTGSENAKIYVYNDLGTDNTPDTSDTLLIASGAIAASADQQYATASDLGGNVTSGGKYWVCVMADTTGFDLVRTATAATSLWYSGYTGGYATPPSTLQTMTEATSRAMSVYVEIK